MTAGRDRRPSSIFDAAEDALVEMSRLQRWALIVAIAGDLDLAAELSVEASNKSLMLAEQMKQAA